MTRTASRSPSRPLVIEALHELQAADLAVYRAIATTPSPTLDRGLALLSRTADRSALWLGVAAGLAARPGRSRQAAVLGVVSVAVASATVNLAAKQLLSRTRPDRTAAVVPFARQVPMPASGSFPSGHSASAFAFASAVGGQLPWTSLPLHLLAAMVAYSRVHTGVHYPADVIIGSLIGAASAAGTTPVVRRMARRGPVPMARRLVRRRPVPSASGRRNPAG